MTSEGETKVEDGPVASAEEEETNDAANKVDNGEETPAPVEKPTAAPTASPETMAALTERLNFFFGNANLRQDNFMRKLLLETNSITVETLLKFNSIKALTSNPVDVVKAAEHLTSVLKVSEDQTTIGRVDPFTTDQMDGNIPLSLYLKEIPHDDGNYKVTVQEIRDFFELYGPVAIIKLGFHHTRNRARKPNGGCMVEFEDLAALEKACSEVVTSKAGAPVEASRKFMVGEQQVQILTLQDHIEQSKKDTEEMKDETKEGHDDEGDVAEVAVDWKKGCVIKLTGLSKDCDREAIMTAVAKELKVTEEIVKKDVYVDFSRGQTDGAVRFQEPSGKIAELCAKLAEGEIQIAGAKVASAKVLEGEEEEQYWKAFIEFKKKQRRLKSQDYSGRNKKRQRRS